MPKRRHPSRLFVLRRSSRWKKGTGEAVPSAGGAGCTVASALSTDHGSAIGGLGTTAGSGQRVASAMLEPIVAKRARRRRGRRRGGRAGRAKKREGLTRALLAIVRGGRRHDSLALSPRLRGQGGCAGSRFGPTGEGGIFWRGQRMEGWARGPPAGSTPIGSRRANWEAGLPMWGVSVLCSAAVMHPASREGSGAGSFILLPTPRRWKRSRRGHSAVAAFSRTAALCLSPSRREHHKAVPTQRLPVYARSRQTDRLRDARLPGRRTETYTWLAGRRPFGKPRMHAALLHPPCWDPPLSSLDARPVQPFPGSRYG